MTHNATSRKLVLVSIGLMLATGAYVTPISAQQQPPAPTPAPKVDAAPMPREAPVGHRQPRAADFPPPQQQTGTAAERDPRDKALDRRLQICRGC
jgi:hypothetical protein